MLDTQDMHVLSNGGIQIDGGLDVGELMSPLTCMFYFFVCKKTLSFLF